MPTVQRISRKSVRQVLKSWYATKELGNHPLIDLRIVEAHRREEGYSETPSGRGLALRETVRAALEAMKPAPGSPDPEDERWWPFFILNEQYLQGRNWQWISEQLHIARRTYYLRQGEALDTLADILRRREEVAQSQAVDRDRRAAPFLAPPRPAHALVGREALLAHLRSQLMAGRDAGLHGLPGAGKTALAIELAHDRAMRQRFADGVLWAGLGRQPDRRALLAGWGRALGLPDEQIAGADEAEELARLIHAAIGDRRLLLVVDDAWRSETALLFRLGGPGCGRIITSRRAAVVLDVAGQGTVHVSELEPDQGMRLLRQMVPGLSEATGEETRELVKAVGGLPLALTLMGRYLRRQGHGGRARRLRAALARLRPAEQRLHLSHPQTPVGRRPDLPPDAPLSLRAAIQLSYDALDEDAAAALHRLAHLPAKPNSFSEAAALAIAGTGPEALDALVDRALMEPAGPDRYTIHQTIVDFARPEAADPETARRLVDHFVDFVRAHREDDSALERDLAHVQAALALAGEREMDGPLTAGILALFPFLLRRGLYHLAVPHLDIAIARARAREDNVALAKLLSKRGIADVERGRIRAAAATFEEVQSIARDAELPEVEAEAMARSGAIAISLGRPREAPGNLEEALRIYRRLDNARGQALAIIGLADAHSKLGNHQEARRRYEEGLALVRRLEDREGEIRLLNLLGNTLVRLGRFDDAGARYRQGLELMQRSGASRFECRLRHGLGNVHLSLGQIRRAREEYRRALARAEETGERQSKASIANNLGLIAMNQGEYEEAEQYFARAVALYQALGNLLKGAVSRHNLGRIHLLQGHYQRARELLQEALQMARRTKDRAGEARTLRNLGILHMLQGEFSEAAPYFQRSLAITTDAGYPLGQSRSFRLCGLLAHFGGDHETALRQAQEAFRIARNTGNRTEQADALTLAGHAHTALEALAEASAAYQEALAVRSELGEEHLAMEALAGLGRLHLTRNERDRALAQVEEILAFLEERSLVDSYERFRIYYTCYVVLRDGGDARACPLLEKAHHLLQEQAAGIPAEKTRRAFLENVPWHRAIVLDHQRENG